MNRKLKIAQLVLPWLPVPPEGYGGTETIVYNLTEGLVKKGHDVTLFSVGESTTSARLVSIFPKALGLQKNVNQTLASNLYPIMHISNCYRMQDEFDIIHSHAQFLSLPFAAVVKKPNLHTFHRELINLADDEKALLNQYKYLNYASISNSQRIEGLNFVKTIYNGIDESVYSFMPSKGQNYLMWAGRVIDKKGPLEAIRSAQKLKMPLVMAGKVTDEKYFDENIKPNIDGNLIKFQEVVEKEEMVRLYQGAKILLVPAKWNEPFGLVMAEAMSCGTPVIGFSEGAIPEIIKDQETGFLVKKENGVEGIVRAIEKINSLQNNDYDKMRQNSRKRVEENFTVEKMVDNYEKVYREIIDASR